jgi:hypothetical protein
VNWTNPFIPLRLSSRSCDRVDLLFFPDFIDEIRWILVQDSAGTSRSTCHIDICLATCSGLLIDSQASLAIMLLRIGQWWRCGVSFDVRLGGVGFWRQLLVSASAGNTMNGSEFFYPCFNLQCFHENYFFCLSFSFHVYVFM